MSKTLYLPEHVAQKMNKEKKEASADSSPVESAYVDAKEKVLDPSLLDKPLTERLPQPTGWRVLVMPYQGATKTQGGIYIPDEVRDREAVATVVAYVLKVGPLAYQDPNKFGPECEPWCKEGAWVCIGRYAGSRFKIDGGEVRIINDDEVIATILEPDDIKHV
jgi:co-chaperonin GroES (HSP10)